MDGVAVVEARGVHRVFGRGDALTRAVDGVDLTVHAGETVAVVGPSGCGKSTLLHLLGGLDRPTAGEVHVAGQSLAGRSERDLAALRRGAVGFVFQAFHLVEELTALENVEVPALLAGIAPRRARQQARELLDRVGLDDRRDHLPAALSGGQRQRVAVARALVNAPLVVFADEPTGNLDSASAQDLLALFHQLHDAGQTFVIVTHDGRVAATADRLVSMRDGRVVDEVRLAGLGHDAGPGGRTDGHAYGVTDADRDAVLGSLFAPILDEG